MLGLCRASMAGLKMGLTIRVQYAHSFGSSRDTASEFSSQFFQARSALMTAWSIAMGECGVSYCIAGGSIVHRTRVSDAKWWVGTGGGQSDIGGVEHVAFTHSSQPSGIVGSTVQ